MTSIFAVPAMLGFFAKIGQRQTEGTCGLISLVTITEVKYRDRPQRVDIQLLARKAASPFEGITREMMGTNGSRK